MSKKERHGKIMELIAKYEIETQGELAERLEAAGFSVTQATVSRDVRELKITKLSNAAGKHVYVHIRPEDALVEEKYVSVLKSGFVSAAPAGNLVVLRTAPGMAMALAAALDAMSLGEALGSIAGDDTIMMAVRFPEDARSVCDKIEKIVRKA